MLLQLTRIRLYLLKTLLQTFVILETLMKLLVTQMPHKNCTWKLWNIWKKMASHIEPFAQILWGVPMILNIWQNYIAFALHSKILWPNLMTETGGRIMDDKC